MTSYADPLPSQDLADTDPVNRPPHVNAAPWVGAGLFLAANVVSAVCASQGWGLAVVLIQLGIMAALLAISVRAKGATAEWMPALTAVCVIVVIPFSLLLPGGGIGPRTIAAGLAQLTAVVILGWQVVARRRAGTDFASQSPARQLLPMPWEAWPLGIVIGGALGLLAHQTIHFPSDTGKAVLSATFWHMGAGGKTSEIVGAIVLAIAVEEGLFRVLLAPLSQSVLGRFSVIFDGAVYATIYAATGSAVFCLAMLAAGALAAWFRLKHGRLGPLLLAHAVASTLAFVVLR